MKNPLGLHQTLSHLEQKIWSLVTHKLASPGKLNQYQKMDSTLLSLLTKQKIFASSKIYCLCDLTRVETLKLAPVANWHWHLETGAAFLFCYGECVLRLFLILKQYYNINKLFI